MRFDIFLFVKYRHTSCTIEKKVEADNHVVNISFILGSKFLTENLLLNGAVNKQTFNWSLICLSGNKLL